MFMLTAGYEEQWCETVSTAHKNFIEQFAFLSLKAGSIKAWLFIFYFIDEQEYDLGTILY